MSLPRVPDRFQILEELARCETGTLLRARDKLLQREVVLKLPPDGLRADLGSEAQRELREARALARVQHRAIVRLLDVLESPAGPVLVLEPTSGETLAERLAREQRLDAASVRALALELAGALAAVHAIGVVHRGITLDQIVLAADGRPLLGGFGFAKFCGSASLFPGTTFLYKRDGQTPTALPPHPAPEQIAGQAADARSDLFGLGWVLYECLTGEQPYPIELESAHWKAPREPRALVPGTPRDLSDALLRCLAKSPAKRFASAEEFSLALSRPSAPAARPGRRKPLLLASGALAVGLAGFGIWHGTRSSVAGQERGMAVHTQADRRLAGRPYQTLRALVIGIDKYAHWPQLGCAVADALAVARVLEAQYGFEPANVVTLTDADATKDRIQREMGQLCEHAGEQDALLVFFARHGQTEELHGGGNMGYLVPVGGETDKSANMVSLIPMDDLERWARKLSCKHVFFVLDACFSGLAASRGMAQEDLQYVGFLASRQSRLVLTAGGKDQQVNETPEFGHSYFTRRLLRALENGDGDSDGNGVITALELWNYLQQTVPKDTSALRHPQIPQYSALPTDEEGQFLFLGAAARAALEAK